MKHKERILDATYNYCTETTASVLKTYCEMKATIDHDPINEKELIAAKDFNSKAPMKVVELTEILDEVKLHYTMLEEFSYMYKEEDIKSKFSALYEAFHYGVPPHGGCAPGLDRILMLLTDNENIREVIAFPFNQKAQDLMMNAPVKVDEKNLKELGLKKIIEKP